MLGTPYYSLFGCCKGKLLCWIRSRYPRVEKACKLTLNHHYYQAYHHHAAKTTTLFSELDHFKERWLSGSDRTTPCPWCASVCGVRHVALPALMHAFTRTNTRTAWVTLHKAMQYNMKSFWKAKIKTRNTKKGNYRKSENERFKLSNYPEIWGFLCGNAF